jgi:hypothetical protein
LFLEPKNLSESFGFLLAKLFLLLFKTILFRYFRYMVDLTDVISLVLINILNII